MPTVFGNAALTSTSTLTATGRRTRNYAHVATGGVTLGGGADVSEYARIRLGVGFDWNIRGSLTKVVGFTWQTGEPPLYWYRVVGKCVSNPGCENTGTLPNDQGCDRSFIVELVGRSVGDVCQQLRDRQFPFPIASVKRHSRPAETAQVRADEAKGIDHSCDRLEPVEFCQLPPCLDYCVDFTGFQRIAVQAFGGVVSIHSFTGTGGVVTGGSAPAEIKPQSAVGSGGIVLGGSAGYRSSGYSYTADTSGAADIVLGGHSGIKCSSWRFTSTGGIVLGGSAGFVSPDYHYSSDGGLVLMGGSAPASPHLGYSTPTGGLHVGGLAGVALKNLHYHARGLAESSWAVSPECSRRTTRTPLPAGWCWAGPLGWFRRSGTTPLPVGWCWGGAPPWRTRT
jgi:hypothetical protein